jgi:hypothetical protein
MMASVVALKLRRKIGEQVLNRLRAAVSTHEMPQLMQHDVVPMQRRGVLFEPDVIG